MILFRLLDWICRTLSLSHLIVFSYFIFPNKFPKCVSEQVHFLLTSDRSPIRPFKKHHRPRRKKGPYKPWLLPSCSLPARISFSNMPLRSIRIWISIETILRSVWIIKRKWRYGTCAGRCWRCAGAFEGILMRNISPISITPIPDPSF